MVSIKRLYNKCIFKKAVVVCREDSMVLKFYTRIEPLGL